MATNYIPDGYYTITPYLIVDGAGKLIEFIETVFDGKVVMKMEGENGKIAHAEIKIGDSMLMLADSGEEWKPTQAMLHLYFEDADTVYQKALDAGAVSIKEPADQFYGDRNSAVKDAFGNFWGISTHIEEVSEEEMQRRMEANSQTAA